MNNQLLQEDTQVELQATFSIGNAEDCEALLRTRLKDFKDVLLFANTDDELTTLASQVDTFLRDYDATKEAYKRLKQAELALASTVNLN